jgi:hypothetical protein
VRLSLAGVAALALSGSLSWADAPVESRYQVNASFSGAWASISNVPGASVTQEEMSVELIGFRRPLRDDETPFSLQPFMQRESTLSLSVDIGRSQLADQSVYFYPTGFVAITGANVDAYLNQWFAVIASASYAYNELGGDVSQTVHVFSTGAGVGFRYRNTRLDLSAGEQVSRTSGAFGPRQGNVSLSAVTVIKRRLSLDASGTLFDGGAHGFFEAGLYPSKWTGVIVSASATRSDLDARQYTGSVGFSCWFDARSGLLAEYTLIHATAPGTSDLADGISLMAHKLLVQAYFRR